MKSRMKYANRSPADFIPREIFQKFKTLPKNFKLVMPFRLFEEDSISVDAVETAISQMKALLVHSIVLTQENNWVLATQVEAYYHDKSMDDVAQNDKSFKFPDKFEVALEKALGMSLGFVARSWSSLPREASPIRKMSLQCLMHFSGSLFHHCW
ncbi:unnamed protein product [Mucor hiemalis]